MNYRLTWEGFGRYQIAPLTEAVPPKLYGGIERVVSFLTEELVSMGHEVTLFASGDSVTRAKLAAEWPRALRFEPSIRDTIAPHMVMIERVARRADEFDVVHCARLQKHWISDLLLPCLR